ncbi:MAG: SDR family NAD(P)-dependent oxidoreductase [Myxococcota bacterium]
MAQWKGMRAVITGASSGLGEEFARRLAADGAEVVLTARREERLAELAEDLRRSHGVEATVVALDLADDDGPRRLFEEATAGGAQVDVLVNNAGFGLYEQFVDGPLDRQRAMMRLNMEALVELSHRFALHMIERGRPGYILNVGSTASYQPVPGFAVYAATKSFVRDFTEALAYELRGTKVRATVLNPGPTRTEFLDVAGMSGTSGFRDRLAFQDADEVVRAGLDAMAAGKPSVVPGWFNKVMAFMTRLGPRRLNAAMAARFMDMGS